MRFPIFLASILTTVLLTSCVTPAHSWPLFHDELQNDWQHWGWAKAVDYKNTAPVHEGATSIRVGAGPWEAIQLHHAPFDAAPYNALGFWIHGGDKGGQQLKVQASLADKVQAPEVKLEPLAPNQWQRIFIPLDQLGIAGHGDVTSILLQNNTPETAPDFFLDDIDFLTPTEANAPLPAPIPAVVAAAKPVKVAPVDVMIDVSANRHPISPLIYGVNFAEAAHTSLRPTVNRWGGNSTSRYNWKLNADNKGKDYFFESLAKDSAEPGADVDSFIDTSKKMGAQAMITVPINGWVAKVGPNRGKLSSYSVAKYGAQQKTDQWMPDAGNGIRSDGQPVTGNDPTDANMMVTPEFQADWVRHLVAKWGDARHEGVRYYILDNEPGLWSQTHGDVVAKAPTGAQLRDKIIAYARAIKAVDPAAQIVGPEEWGWTGYLYSPADIQAASQSGNWDVSTFADRKAMGGQDFQPWLVAQLRAEEKHSGQKLLDVFTLHIYPQAKGIGLEDRDFSAEAQRMRNRSTRVLWDPNYTDESWVNDKIQIIPRMKKWVQDNDPGTKIGITEYCWSADDHINGATAQADVLGIMGREGVDIATRWVAPTPGTVTFKAFQLYRNYDSKNSGFGDISVQTTAPNPDQLAAFGALRTQDGAFTAMVIHKELGQIVPLRLHLAHFAGAKKAQHWQLTAENRITRLPDVEVKNGLLATDLPPQSINLFVVAK